MHIDFTQFQQFINRLLFNSSQSISKLKELSIDPARIVEVRYYDDNGNLQIVNVPNFNKIMNDVQNNINSFMAKIAYVDQVNGNDDNDGTQDRPFKTLQKAFNSVPVGGVVNITLLSDYVLTSIEQLLNRTCFLQLNGKTLTTEIGTSAYNNNYAGFKGYILMRNSYFQIEASTGKIVIPINDTGKPLLPIENKLIATYSLTSFNTLLIHINSQEYTPWCEINSGALYGISQNGEGKNAFLYFGLRPFYKRIAVVDVDAGARLIAADEVILATNITINNDGITGYLRKPDGTNLTVPDVISGLVYDTVSTPNGTRLIPRNYIGRNDFTKIP